MAKQTTPRIKYNYTFQVLCIARWTTFLAKQGGSYFQNKE